MSLDIYKYRHQPTPVEKNFLWSITEEEFSQLKNCFSIFNRRTGKFFDEYGDLEFPRGTLVPLRESIDEAMQSEKEKSVLSALEKLKSTVYMAIEQDLGLVFYGD